MANSERLPYSTNQNFEHSTKELVQQQWNFETEGTGIDKRAKFTGEHQYKFEMQIQMKREKWKNGVRDTEM